jgi:putative aldouronate transport system permease protein
MRKSHALSDKIFDIVNYTLLILLIIVTLYPFLNTIALSLNNAQDSVRGGIYLWPRQFTWANYKYIFSDNNILHATLISVLRTVIGTLVTVFSSAIVAYAISREYFVLRKFVTIAFVLTMYINAGLIPNYLLIRDLGMIGSFEVYILPGIIGVFNLIIIRSFIENLPDSIIESAKIDGAGDFRAFFSIVLPLSAPVLATVSLFTGVFQWNSWFDVFLYNSSHIDLSTLQYELQKILASSSSVSQKTAADAFANVNSAGSMVTPTSIRAAMTMIATVPIMLVYPFLQKYFVKGMMVGGVKG